LLNQPRAKRDPMKKVSFRTSSYFPFGILAFGVILGLTGFAIITVKPVVAAILLIISAVILTTHYRMEVNFTKMQYRDCVWLLGIRTGEPKAFAGIEYIFVKRIKVSQTMSMRVVSTTLQKEQFDAYLKFGENDKVHLMTYDNRAKLMKRLKEIATQLNTRVVDQSQPVTF
jgi:hypothetical protein